MEHLGGGRERLHLSILKIQVVNCAPLPAPEIETQLHSAVGNTLNMLMRIEDLCNPNEQKNETSHHFKMLFHCLGLNRIDLERTSI